MKTCLTVVTVRLPADGIAQDTRPVFSAIPVALDDVVDEPDIPGIEELFDAGELLDDAAEPQPTAVSPSPSARKLGGNIRRFPRCLHDALPNVSRAERSTMSPRDRARADGGPSLRGQRSAVRDGA